MRIPVLRVILLVALGLGLVGYFAPWVAHKAAALVLVGQDMAEFVKFLPEVRAGELHVLRQLYYLPLLAGGVGLLFAAANRRLGFPWPVRWLMVVLAVPVSLSMLPPAWTPRLMLQPEFRLQSVAIAVCLLLAGLNALLRRVSPILLEWVAAFLALVAAAVPPWQFLRLRPALDSVYGRPIDLGWGVWLTPLGFGVLAVALMVPTIARWRAG